MIIFTVYKCKLNTKHCQRCFNVIEKYDNSCFILTLKRRQIKTLYQRCVEY